MKNGTLLEKIRYINKLIQEAGERLTSFDAGAKAQSVVLNANVFILSSRGRILGHHLMEGYTCDILNKIVEDGRFPAWYNEKFLLPAEESMVNVKQKTPYCVFSDKDKPVECSMSEMMLGVIPIIGLGRRFGTLLLYRFDEPFTVDDLILAENSAAITSMSIMQADVETQKEEARYKAVIDVAFDSLSYSELEALEDIFAELDDKEGIIIAGKIADNLGITRSVIVNALRKFESAGVIDSRSLGMKGTFIRVKHPLFMKEIEKRISRANKSG